MTELLNLEQVAKETHSSIHTVRSWVYQHRIPFTRIGRKVLVPRNDLEKILKRNYVAGKV